MVDAADGREVATTVWNYAHGDHGVILSADPNLARQHPADYVTGAEKTIKQALAFAKKNIRGFFIRLASHRPGRGHHRQLRPFPWMPRAIRWP